jgi:CheY-like chemotaxis protein
MPVSPRNILIVDDSPFFRVSLSDMLAEAGHSVRSVKNGKEAIEEIKKGADKIDLLILDLEMPEVDGFGVLRWINENACGGKFPVVTITSIYEPTQVMQALKSLGAIGFLQKELPHEHLLININRLLASDEKTIGWINKGRVPVCIPAVFTAGGREYKGSLINISESGAFLRADAELSDGETLKLEFTLERQVRALKVEGAVRWHTHMGQANARVYWYGIMFTSADEDCRAALRDFIAETRKLGLEI